MNNRSIERIPIIETLTKNGHQHWLIAETVPICNFKRSLCIFEVIKVDLNQVFHEHTLSIYFVYFHKLHLWFKK